LFVKKTKGLPKNKEVLFNANVADIWETKILRKITRIVKVLSDYDQLLIIFL